MASNQIINDGIKFTDIPAAVEIIRNGGMVVVMDDECRENEGDIIMAAECVTAPQCALTIRHTTGILCAPMTAERAAELELPRMVKKNQDPNGTAFTITCDSINTTTGVSAQDRTRTFLDLANASCGPTAFSRPGHVFPLIAKEGGVLERRGHTEAGVDLCRMAGLTPVAFIAELCNDDGTMMRLPDCAKFAVENKIPLITVEAMVKHLENQGSVSVAPPLAPLAVEHVAKAVVSEAKLTASVVSNSSSSDESPKSVIALPECVISLSDQEHIDWPKAEVQVVDVGGNIDFVASTLLPTSTGQYKVLAFRNRVTKAEPLILAFGDIADAEELPVRVHDQCLTSEVFASLRCDCNQQLHAALAHIRANGKGAVIYLQQEGRGIGLANKIAAYALQEKGFDTVDANRKLGLPDDARKYECVGPILKHLGVKSVALLTNNPRKIEHLTRSGVTVSSRLDCAVSLESVAPEARSYISTKTKRMGHITKATPSLTTQ